MNWNNRYLWGIVGVIILFLCFNVFLVTTSFSTDFHLVDENYYEKEIGYQTKIEQIKRANELSSSIRLIDNQPESVRFEIPKEWINNIQTGSINFYRPSDAELDRNYPLSVDNSGVQTISLTAFTLGKWKVAIEWTMDDFSYFEEFNLYIK